MYCKHLEARDRSAIGNFMSTTTTTFFMELILMIVSTAAVQLGLCIFCFMKKRSEVGVGR